MHVYFSSFDTVMPRGVSMYFPNTTSVQIYHLCHLPSIDHSVTICRRRINKWMNELMNEFFPSISAFFAFTSTSKVGLLPTSVSMAMSMSMAMSTSIYGDTCFCGNRSLSIRLLTHVYIDVYISISINGYIQVFSTAKSPRARLQ
jgi:hypothetical protein